MRAAAMNARACYAQCANDRARYKRALLPSPLLLYATVRYDADMMLYCHCYARYIDSDITRCLLRGARITQARYSSVQMARAEYAELIIAP